MTHQAPPGDFSKLKLAAGLYGVFVVIALGWGLIAGRPLPVLHPNGGSSWTSTLLGALFGLILGILVVAISRLLVAYLRWAKKLYTWFAQVLGPMSRGEVLGLALLSSIGEEILFRGAMQPTLGLWITTIIFGLLHIPPKLHLWPWTLMAGMLGLIFGLMTQWSGNIAGAVVAHFVINALNLGHIAQFIPSDAQENLPGDAPPSSMNQDENLEECRSADGAAARGGADLSHPGR